MATNTWIIVSSDPEVSGEYLRVQTPLQKDCIMYFPHTVASLAAPIWTHGRPAHRWDVKVCLCVVGAVAGEKQHKQR